MTGKTTEGRAREPERLFLGWFIPYAGAFFLVQLLLFSLLELFEVFKDDQDMIIMLCKFVLNLLKLMDHIFVHEHEFPELNKSINNEHVYFISPFTVQYA